MGLTSNIKDNDFVSIRQAIAKLGSIKFGPTSSPTFAGLTLTGLDASEFVFTNASKELVSINVPLVVAYGGTGAATLTDHSLLVGSGTDAVTALGAATDGQLPIGSTGADPVLAALTGTTNQITVTNGAGSITLATPQNIHTGADPTFAGLNITNCADLVSNSAVFQPATDFTTFFQVNDKDGNNILTIDTVNNAWLPVTTKLGTTEGSYNFVNGSAFAAKTGYTYCVAVGSNIANAATGYVFHNNLVGISLANAAEHIYRNNIVGAYLATAATGYVYRNNIVGDYLANAATGNVLYNNLVGMLLAGAATGSVTYNNMVGSSLANAATGEVAYNNMVGYQNADAATGSIINCTIYGSNIAHSFTGSMNSVFSCGTLNLYNCTNETNLSKVIAFPYESLRESSAADLDNAIAIGYRAGYQNAYNNPGLFGTQATAYANTQCVLGSSYYTGGVVLDNERIYLHNSTHEDTDGGREIYLDFWGEQSGGEKTTLARIEASHDGAADDEKGKIVLSTNDGNDGDTPTPHIKVDAAGITYIGDAGTTNYTQIDTTGDVLFGGSSGLAYGSMYSISDMAITLTTQNVWYEIDAATAWVTGKVHNCTFTDPYLVATNAGTYLITWNITGRCDTANQIILVGIMIDQTNTDNPAHGAAGVQGEGRNRIDFLNANRRLPVSGSAILQLAAGKKVSLALCNTTSAGKVVTVGVGNLKMVQIAGGSA